MWRGFLRFALFAYGDPSVCMTAGTVDDCFTVAHLDFSTSLVRCLSKKEVSPAIRASAQGMFLDYDVRLPACILGLHR
ncbi:hypothetical protein ACNKHV_18485 [Shigella flexneri]